jgi:hypothetical protein
MAVVRFPQDELADVRELLDEFVAALDHEAAPEDAAAVELLALDLQAPFALPDAPPELVHELTAALGRRGDETAADLLVALERLTPEPLAGLAATERMRLERVGVAAPHAEQIGKATLAEAHVLSEPDGGAEVWHVVLRRPDSDLGQTIVAFVEHEPCGAVIAGLASAVLEAGPEPLEALRQLSDRPAEPLADRDLLDRLREALAHMERHDVALASAAAQGLLLLERALTGRAGGLPRPPIEPPDPDEDVEAELYEDADFLVDAFSAALDEDEHIAPTLREEGPFIARCMLDWKLGYGDGRLERWTLGDLRELLLDWFPRKVTADDETIAIGAEAVSRFLRFLADEDVLDAPVPLASLEAAVQRLRPQFEQACRDPRRWGPAKSLVAEMEADGVDLADEHAVAAWIESYNAPLFNEHTSPPPARAREAKRAKRKATRRARRRNRR